MIKNRVQEIWIGMILVMLISGLAFYFDGPVDMRQITGYTVYEPEINTGMEFRAVVEGREYFYSFYEGDWFESKDKEEWEYRIDMGETLWSGLIYLQSYDAEIFYDGRKIYDLAKFARELR